MGAGVRGVRSVRSGASRGRVWWFEGLLGVLGGVSQLAPPVFTHRFGFSGPAPPSCPQPPAPPEQSRFHLVAAGQPEGHKMGDLEVSGPLKYRAPGTLRSHVGTLTPAEPRSLRPHLGLAEPLHLLLPSPAHQSPTPCWVLAHGA